MLARSNVMGVLVRTSCFLAASTSLRSPSTGCKPVPLSRNFVLQSECDLLKMSRMPTRSEAEENLRVIRSLMEKATIYRAISAPTALVGGLCATIFGLWLYFRWLPLRGGDSLRPELVQTFIGGWLTVLGITAVTNALLIWQAARR